MPSVRILVGASSNAYILLPWYRTRRDTALSNDLTEVFTYTCTCARRRKFVWLPGTLVGKRGSLSLDLDLEDGQVLKRTCEAPREERGNQFHDSVPFPIVPPTEESTCEPVSSTPNVTLRRSTRERRPPDRYQSAARRFTSSKEGGV